MKGKKGKGRTCKMNKKSIVANLELPSVTQAPDGEPRYQTNISDGRYLVLQASTVNTHPVVDRMIGRPTNFSYTNNMQRKNGTINAGQIAATKGVGDPKDYFHHESIMIHLIDILHGRLNCEIGGDSFYSTVEVEGERIGTRTFPNVLKNGAPVPFCEHRLKAHGAGTMSVIK